MTNEPGDKILPTDLAESIERFIVHLCCDEIQRDLPTGCGANSELIAQYRRKYDVEIRRHLAHIWECRGQQSSVAWIVIANNTIKSTKTPSNGAASYSIYFKRGDILKSATWKAPAKNFARGNVLTDTAFPRWHWNGWI